MYLQPAPTIRFDGDLDRLIDDPYRRADRHNLEQGLNIVRSQPDAASTYPQANAKILVGAVDQVVAFAITKAHGELAEGILRAGGHHGGQGDPFLLQPGFAHHGAGHPGRVGILLDDGGGHLRSLAADITNPDGQHDDLVLPFGEVVEAQFGQIDDDPLARHIGQQHLGGQRQTGAWLG